MSQFCTGCGVPTGGALHFCPNCGARLSAPDTTTPAPPQQHNEAASPPPQAAPPQAAPPQATAPPPQAAQPPASTPVGPPPDDPPPARRAAPKKTHLDGLGLVQLEGAIIAALSVYLPWIRTPEDSVNAFQLPLLILLDYDTTTFGVDLGILIVVLAGVVLADVLVRSPTLSKITLGIGIALIIISLLFVVQLARGASATSQSLGDIIGFAPLVTSAAGAMIITAKGMARSSSSTTT